MAPWLQPCFPGSGPISYLTGVPRAQDADTPVFQRLLRWLPTPAAAECLCSSVLENQGPGGLVLTRGPPDQQVARICGKSAIFAWRGNDGARVAQALIASLGWGRKLPLPRASPGGPSPHPLLLLCLGRANCLVSPHERTSVPPLQRQNSQGVCGLRGSCRAGLFALQPSWLALKYFFILPFYQNGDNVYDICYSLNVRDPPTFRLKLNPCL